MIPEVSVVIPTRDRLHLLPRTLGSVLWQRGVELEVVVVDDGSRDGTAEWITGLADPRVRVVRHGQPRGVAGARNAGIQAADAPWVALLDDDDMWAPDKLACQLTALAERPDAAWVATGIALVDEDLRVLTIGRGPSADGLLTTLLRWNCVSAGSSTVLARKALIEEVGGFDTTFSHLADWDMWIRMAEAAPMITVSDPLVAYYVHLGSMSHHLRGAAAELRVLLNKHAHRRKAHDIRYDRRLWNLWVAEQHQRAGHRIRAASAWLGTVGHVPAGSAVQRAGGAIVFGAPRQRRRDDWAARDVDPRRIEPIDAWLADLRPPFTDAQSLRPAVVHRYDLNASPALPL